MDDERKAPVSDLHSVIVDGCALQVPIRPYVSKRNKEKKEKKEEKEMPKSINLPLVQAQQFLNLEGEMPKAKILSFGNGEKRTLVRNDPYTLQQSKIRKEIQIQKKVVSIRDKLGKSKRFEQRDNAVLRQMQQPTIVSHKVGYGVPSNRVEAVKEEGMRKILGLQYRQIHDRLARNKNR